MLKLCGFPASNYYNKVKLVLLEKGIAFEEELVYPSRGAAFLKRAPMGKIPVLETNSGSIYESQAIVEYLEDAYSQPPLYPRHAIDAARCRSVIQLIELYLEWPVRRLYPAALFGGPADPGLRQEVSAQLEQAVKAFGLAIKCDPFLMGEEFTLADCAAYAHLPLISTATKTMYGRDIFASLPAIGPYLERIAARPHFQRVQRDRKANIEHFMAYRRGKA